MKVVLSSTTNKKFGYLMGETGALEMKALLSFYHSCGVFIITGIKKIKFKKIKAGTKIIVHTKNNKYVFSSLHKKHQKRNTK